MVEEEDEKTIPVPIEIVWDWSKDIRNIVSVIPQIKIMEEISDRKLRVRGEIFRGSSLLPDELLIGESETIEVNETEKYTRSVTEGEIYQVETFLRCEKATENETRVKLKTKGKLKGFSGKILEKFIFLPGISKIALPRKIDEILGNWGTT